MISIFLSNLTQVHPGVGLGPDLVRGEAAVGRRPRGVRERHVERDRLRDQLLVRGHRRPKGGRLLQGQVGDREIGIGGRAPTRTVGHVGPDAHIGGSFLRRQHIQVFPSFEFQIRFSPSPSWLLILQKEINFVKGRKKKEM